MSLMRVHNTVDLDIPEGRRLADLFGISVDLEAVRDYCGRIIAHFDEGIPDFQLTEALWIAALVRYARCFTTNRAVRSPLGKKDIRTLPAHLAQLHSFAIDLRNKHIAHSENPLEQNRVGVVVAPRESPALEGISLSNQNVSFVSGHVAEDMRDLSSILLTRVEEQIESEKARVLQIAHRLPIEQFYAKETWKIQVPDVQDVSRRRER
jgi:hypothetical protein